VAGKVEYSAEARRDLLAIRRWSIKNFGARQTNAYLAHLHETLRLVSEFRGMALDASDIAPGMARVILRSHVAFVAMDTEKPLKVVRILHASMDHQRHLS
jgi:toxin ParE1/3/4